MTDGASYLNELSTEAATDALRRCCASRRWVASMLDRRPFADREALHLAARNEWRNLAESDWLEAFEAHPRIGATDVHERWSRREQAGAMGASSHVLDALVRGNQEYEQRFGFIFLICASGLTAEQILEALQVRLSHQRAEELGVAAQEHEKITAIRLDRIADKV